MPISHKGGRLDLGLNCRYDLTGRCGPERIRPKVVTEADWLGQPRTCIVRTQDEIREAAEVANAHNFIKELPDGYQTQVHINLCPVGNCKPLGLTSTVFALR
jgi:hypothetical protein